MDTAAITLESIENKLYQAAQGYPEKGLWKQLMKEALATEITEEEAQAVVSQVMRRLRKSRTKQSAFGVAHNPTTQFERLKRRIAELRG